MYIHRTLIICGLLFTTTLAAEEHLIASNVIYFKKDWCPVKAELQELSTRFRLIMNDCCIASAESINNDKDVDIKVLQPYINYITPDQDISWCRGTNVEQQNMQKQAVQTAESTRMKAALEERTELPSILRKLDMPLICVEIGKLIRGESWFVVAPNMQAAALPLIKAELTRRSVKINDNQVKLSKISIGASECQMYASRGLPIQSNITDTSSTTYIQHIYNHYIKYVYTQNGIITSWQN